MKDIYRRKIHPFNKIDGISVPISIIPLGANHPFPSLDPEMTGLLDIVDDLTPFHSSELYIEIQDEMKFREIDIKVWDTCISFPVSETFFENNKLAVYANGEKLSEMDIKYFVLYGYIYIFHKGNFDLENLIIIKTANDISTTNSDNSSISNPYGEDLTLNLKSPIFPNLAVNLPGRYLILEPNQTLFEFFKDVLNIDKNQVFEKVYDLHITGIYAYNETTGFNGDDNLKEQFPLWLKNKSTDHKMIVFYDSNPVNEEPPYKEDNLYRDKLRFIYNNINQKKAFNKMEIFKDEDTIPYDVIHPKYCRSDELLYYLRDFHWDAYIELDKEYNNTNFLFTPDQFIKSKKLETLTRITSDPASDPNGEWFISVTFNNYKGLVPEIYYNGMRYGDYKLIEHKDDQTTVSFKIEVFLKYFGLYKPYQIDHIYIVLKPRDFLHSNYHNIFEGYNGVIPIGESFYNKESVRYWNNGFIMNDYEYEINSLPPYGLRVLFPRRKAKSYHIVSTGYPYDHTYSKTYKLQLEDQSNVTDLEPNKYLIKSGYYSYLITDYIDHNYQIYCGPYILMEGRDYILLSNKLIVFLNPFYKYKEDKTPDDFIKITIENNFSKDDHEWKKERMGKSSLFNRILFDKEMYKMIGIGIPYNKERIRRIKIGINKDDRVDCPDLYREDIFRWHMCVTKYHSTENVLLGTSNDPYGQEWYRGIELEFPEFIDSSSTNPSIEWVFNTNRIDISSLDETPRVIPLMEDYPLNQIMTHDIVAKRKLIQENMDIIGTKMEWNHNYFFYKKLYEKNLIRHLIPWDIAYISEIPFDCIYDLQIYD